MIRKTGITSDKGCQELLVSSNALLYHSLVQLTWRELKILDLKPNHSIISFLSLFIHCSSKFLTLSLMLHTLRWLFSLSWKWFHIHNPWYNQKSCIDSKETKNNVLNQIERKQTQTFFFFLPNFKTSLSKIY